MRDINPSMLLMYRKVCVLCDYLVRISISWNLDLCFVIFLFAHFMTADRFEAEFKCEHDRPVFIWIYFIILIIFMLFLRFSQIKWNQIRFWFLKNQSQMRITFRKKKLLEQNITQAAVFTVHFFRISNLQNFYI